MLSGEDASGSLSHQVMVTLPDPGRIGHHQAGGSQSQVPDEEMVHCHQEGIWQPVALHL